MKKLLQNDKYSFKKGEIVHLDNFLSVSAFVQVDGRTKPHKSPHVRHNWEADLSDEYEVLKDFEVEVKVWG